MSKNVADGKIDVSGAAKEVGRRDKMVFSFSADLGIIKDQTGMTPSEKSDWVAQAMRRSAPFNPHM